MSLALRNEAGALPARGVNDGCGGHAGSAQMAMGSYILSASVVPLVRKWVLLGMAITYVLCLLDCWKWVYSIQVFFDESFTFKFGCQL